MAGIPGYTFTCKNCGNELVIERLGTTKFSVVPCLACTPVSVVSTAPVRNLLYHVTPIANYKWNIEQLTKRWSVFTGKKVIAVAYDTNCDSIEKVKELFPKEANIHFVEVSNHPELRETHSLATLLLHASQFDRSGSTFYAHTKGVTRKDDPAVTLWTDAMYHYNLGAVEAADAQLKQFPVTGCCKRYGKFAHFPKHSNYHYSGTFFWFRNKDLFDRAWTQVPQIRYGAEAYISLLFKDAEAGCLWGNKFQNGYDWQYLKPLVQNDPYFKEFLDKHIDHNPNWSKTRSLRTVQTLDRTTKLAPKRVDHRR